MYQAPTLVCQMPGGVGCCVCVCVCLSVCLSFQSVRIWYPALKLPMELPNGTD